MKLDTLEGLLETVVECKFFWQARCHEALAIAEEYRKRLEALELENAALMASVNAKTNGADA